MWQRHSAAAAAVTRSYAFNCRCAPHSPLAELLCNVAPHRVHHLRVAKALRAAESPTISSCPVGYLAAPHAPRETSTMMATVQIAQMRVNRCPSSPCIWQTCPEPNASPRGEIALSHPPPPSRFLLQGQQQQADGAIPPALRLGARQRCSGQCRRRAAAAAPAPPPRAAPCLPALPPAH